MSFARHGIKHLSASSLNLWKNEPALWALRYLHGIKDEAGPAAWRGTAVEAGLDAVLFSGADEQTAAKIALDNFDLNVGGVIDDDTEAERANIAKILQQATEAVKIYGKPISRQEKIEFWLEGIDFPVIGFTDYRFPDFILDLKTTLRMPSEPRPDHIVQMAVYSGARDLPAFLLYVTPKKFQPYQVTEEQVKEGLWVLRRSALALKNVLAFCQTKEQIAEMIVPRDMTNYLWNDTTRQAAANLWR